MLKLGNTRGGYSGKSDVLFLPRNLAFHQKPAKIVVNLDKKCSNHDEEPSPKLILSQHAKKNSMTTFRLIILMSLHLHIFNFLFYLSVVYFCSNLFPSKFIFSLAQINFRHFVNFMFVNIRGYYIHVANIYLHWQLSYWERISIHMDSRTVCLMIKLSLIKSVIIWATASDAWFKFH